MGASDEQLDRLYGAPLEEFTPARNELAAELRDGGDSKGASAVKRLRKPTRAAWLVNQLARRKPEDVERLLATGVELRELQEQMLAGSVDPAKLREAAASEQMRIDALLKAARAIGAEHDVGSAILDRVGESLQAASSDSEVADAVRAGRLDRERRASGIGLPGAAAPRPKGKRKDADAAKRRAAQEEAKRRKRGERKLASAEQRLEKAEQAVARAQSVLEEKEDVAGKAERARNAARRDLDELG